MIAGVRIEFVNAGVANAALRHIEHSLHIYFIGFVNGSTQISECIFHLATLIKTSAANNFVRNTKTYERLFKNTTLRISTVKNGHFAPLARIGFVCLVNLLRNPARFIVLIIGVITHDGVACSGVAPEVLWLALNIVGYNRIGCIQNILCAAIVLRQHHSGDIRKCFLKLHDVAKICAAKSVNRLVGIAHNANIVVLCTKHKNNFVLGNVGVLVFVYQNVLKALLVHTKHIGMLLEELHGTHEQIVEVHCACAF